MKSLWVQPQRKQKVWGVSKRRLASVLWVCVWFGCSPPPSVRSDSPKGDRAVRSESPRSTSPETPHTTQKSPEEAELAPPETSPTDKERSLLPKLRAVESDRGVFEHLNARVKVSVPAWIPKESLWVLQSPKGNFLMVGTHTLAKVDDTSVASGVRGAIQNDLDGDGVPNSLDVIRGAHKVVHNGAAYRGGYVALSYPGGDVPSTQGVCTDVVVRVLRNAGLDLQKSLHEDIRAHRKRYPMVRSRANPHIDHRRVRTLLPWFQNAMEERDPDVTQSLGDWLPGDIVFMDTLPRSGPDHIGVVSDTLGESGYPKIVNNWTDGYTTSAMDLLGSIPVTHRFRWVSKAPLVGEDNRGLLGVLKRAGVKIPQGSEQVVLVVADHWNHNAGSMRRFVLRDGVWTHVGETEHVRLGRAGLGWGLGLHHAPSDTAPQKHEGDRRSPVGVFRLGTAFGRKGPVSKSTWPWRRVRSQDRYVDDPKSPVYNTWQEATEGGAVRWSSAEKMSIYNLGIVVHHNHENPVSGRGSAIFMHDALGGGDLQPTLGCTAVETGALRTLIRWLKPEAKPVLVQVQGVYF